MKKSQVSQKAEGKVWRLEDLSRLQLCVSGINRGPIRWGPGGCTRCRQTQIPRGWERKDSQTSRRWLSSLPSPTSTRAFRGFPLLLSRVHLHSLEGQQQRAMSKRPNSGPQLGGLTGGSTAWSLEGGANTGGAASWNHHGDARRPKVQKASSCLLPPQHFSSGGNRL